MSTLPKKFAWRDVATAHFFDLVTGELIASVDTLKTSGVEFTTESVAARGGVGNHKLVVFSGTKDGKVTLQDALFDMDTLALTTGSQTINGPTKVLLNETLSVSGGDITLKGTPDGDPVSVILKNAPSYDGADLVLTKGAPATVAGEYSITGKVITVHSSIPDGSKIVVFYHNTVVKTSINKISATSANKSYRVVMDTSVVDYETKQQFAAQILIPEVKPDENFSLALSAEGEPTPLDINLEIMKPADSEDLFFITIFDEADIV